MGLFLGRKISHSRSLAKKYHARALDLYVSPASGARNARRDEFRSRKADLRDIIVGGQGKKRIKREGRGVKCDVQVERGIWGRRRSQEHVAKLALVGFSHVTERQHLPARPAQTSMKSTITMRRTKIMQ